MRTILIHVNRVRACGFGLWVRVNLTRPESANIVCTRASFPSRSCQSQLFVLLGFRLVQELLIPLQALSCCPSNDRGYCSPLGRHQFG